MTLQAELALSCHKKSNYHLFKKYLNKLLHRMHVSVKTMNGKTGIVGHRLMFCIDVGSWDVEI